VIESLVTLKLFLSKYQKIEVSPSRATNSEGSPPELDRCKEKSTGEVTKL
jgi:hypothetical protein